MYDLAVQALASGGDGGHGGRRIMILAVVVILVAVVAGWIIYARRVRRNERQS